MRTTRVFFLKQNNFFSLLFRGDHRERRRKKSAKMEDLGNRVSIGRDRQRSNISPVGGGGFLRLRGGLGRFGVVLDDIHSRRATAKGVGGNSHGGRGA